ncbi:MAG TPA: NAD(P)H-dependent oxidoreductase [Micromonosporaceae bacterium]
MPRLTVIVASTRPGRSGRQIADWFTATAARQGDFEITLADLAEIKLPFLDEPHHPSEGRYVHDHTRRWSAVVDASDAFVFVMPEYNAGFNAPLKNAIDFLYHEWRYKPVGFVSYGTTASGHRAVQMIKQVVMILRMTPVADAVSIPLKQYVDQDGKLVPAAAMEEAAVKMLGELRRFADAFAGLRAPA